MIKGCLRDSSRSQSTARGILKAKWRFLGRRRVVAGSLGRKAPQAGRVAEANL